MSTSPIGGGPTPLPLDTTAVGDTGAPERSAAAQASVRLLDAAGVDPKTLGVLHGNDPSAGVPQPADEAGPGVSLGSFRGAITDAETSVQTDTFAFMALFAKIQQGMRDNARAERTAELQSQVGSLRAAASEMIKAGDERLAGAIVDGLAKAGTGAMSIAGGLGGLRAMSATRRSVEFSGADDFSTSRGSSFNFAEGSPDMARMGAVNRMGDGLGGLVEGGAHLTGGILEHGAGEHDAEAKRDEAEGVQAEARGNQAQDLMAATADTLRDLREKLAAMEQSNVETLRGMARNI